MRFWFIYPFIVMLLTFCSGLYGRTIWQERNLYSSQATLQNGDVIVIRITDETTMRMDFRLNRVSNANVNSTPDVEITGFLPKASASNNFSNSSTSEYEGRNRIAFRMAARITNQAAPNQFQIQGTRTYLVNGITYIVAVTGTIDPALVKGRVIDSHHIDNFQMNIRSEKAPYNITRPAPGPEDTASAELTEEEKQQIIVEYLQRILGELNQ